MTRIWAGIAVACLLGLGVAGAAEIGKPDRPMPRRPSLRGQPERGPSAASAAGAVSRDASPGSTGAAAPAVAHPPAPGVTEPVPVVPAKEGERRHTRVVVRLKGVPALDVANTVNQLLRAEGQAVKSAAARSVVIVPDPVSNSLVIGGPPDAVEEVRKLVEELDRPAVMVRLEVVIGEAPAGEVKDGPAGAKQDAKKPAPGAAGPLRPVAKPENLEIVVRGELTTLDNQAAFLQVGRREPRVTGSSFGPPGRMNQITMENVGTIVGFTPRVGADQAVTLAIDIEESRLGPPEEGAAISVSSQGETTRTPNTETLTAQTTLRIPDGQTVVLGGMARQSKSGKARVILVTPHVLRMSGEK